MSQRRAELYHAASINVPDLRRNTLAILQTEFPLAAQAIQQRREH